MGTLQSDNDWSVSTVFLEVRLITSADSLSECFAQAAFLPRSLKLRLSHNYRKGLSHYFWNRHHQFFALADLEHTVVSLAALFALLLYLYHEDLFALRLHPKAQLFAIETQPTTIVAGGYALPDFP